MNPVPRFNVAQSQEAYDFMDARVSAFLADMISAEQMITEIQKSGKVYSLLTRQIFLILVLISY